MLGMKTLIEAAIVLLPIAPFVNLYRYSGVLRRLSLFPRLFGILSFGIMAYLTLSVLLTWYLARYSAFVMIMAAPLVFTSFTGEPGRRSVPAEASLPVLSN